MGEPPVLIDARRDRRFGTLAVLLYEANLQHRVQLYPIGRHASLPVNAVEEADARDLHVRLTVLEPTGKLPADAQEVIAGCLHHVPVNGVDRPFALGVYEFNHHRVVGLAGLVDHDVNVVVVFELELLHAGADGERGELRRRYAAVCGERRRRRQGAEGGDRTGLGLKAHAGRVLVAECLDRPAFDATSGPRCLRRSVLATGTPHDDHDADSTEQEEPTRGNQAVHDALHYVVGVVPVYGS